MDMRNVKNLTIPEGTVRTIHDKNNRLLWGAVGYNITYRGNTFQQAYSGKNLLNINALNRQLPFSSTSAGITFTINADGSMTINGKNDNTGNSVIYIYGSGTSLPLKAGKYIGSFDNLSITGLTLMTYDGSSYRNLANSTQTFPDCNVSVYIQVVRGNTTVYSNEKVNIMIEAGSTITPYEPYVGSTSSQITPAPNPDYPQDVDVVTGMQTITISDGTLSENFTVDLGNTELCKIGTYQDYIYRSSDEWYVHKEINKITLDGTQQISNYNWRPTSTSVGWIYPYSLTNNVPVQNSGIVGPVISDKLVATSYGNLYNNVSDMGVGVYTTNALGLVVKTNDTTLTTTSAINSFLSSNPITVYYALATPTDTKITDSTLIEELEAIHQWLTRYGYNATVSGNLPIIIDRINL